MTFRVRQETAVPRGARVSPHFSFAELTTTEHRDFLDEQADAPPEVRANLVRLTVDVLEPARLVVGALRVNSGYRCPGLNAAIGGAKKSAHMDGRAADVFPLTMDIRDAYRRLAKSAIPFDQLIFEYGRWLHVACPRHGEMPRRQLLAIYAPGSYETWSPSDPRFRGTEAAC